MDGQAVTLTFFSLLDYVADLQRRGICESYLASTTELVPLSQGLARSQFKVICTALDPKSREILVCALFIGQCIAHAEEHEPWHRENAILAKRLVSTFLLDKGLRVLPGMYGYKASGQAGCHLWRFDKETRKLVDVAADGAADKKTRKLIDVAAK